jgi:hypothetical protein
MTVLIYVNTNKERSAIPTISRCLRTRTLQKHGSRKTTRKAWRLSTRFSSKPKSACDKS